MRDLLGLSMLMDQGDLLLRPLVMDGRRCFTPRFDQHAWTPQWVRAVDLVRPPRFPTPKKKRVLKGGIRCR